ncbi:MAG TPA: hypothetical protein DEP84_26525 [Chloroflexi bacterium]|nr:hypothetical protein [Chloroflexota bacterium]
MSQQEHDPIKVAWQRFQEGRQHRKGAGELTILGGQFTPEQLVSFLEVWSVAELPYRIWEHVSRIEWRRTGDPTFKAQPDNLDYLQRADLFGDGGHLSLRRDGDCWFWHFVGPAGQQKPKGFEKETETFTQFPQGGFRCYEERVLLWGEHKERPKTSEADGSEGPARWWDDRVAAANLRYPIDPTARVCLRFWRLSEGGTTAFVWYRGLEKAETQPESKHG